MRKMMMVALFSVLSLSACAVEEASQTQAPIDDIETADTDAPCDGSHPEAELPTVPANHDMETRTTDIPPVLSAIPCDGPEDCWSNVCDLEKKVCREYPF